VANGFLQAVLEGRFPFLEKAFKERPHNFYVYFTQLVSFLQQATCVIDLCVTEWITLYPLALRFPIL